MDNIEEKKVAQDPDIKDKKGTQPKKYYSGLSKSTKEKRDAHFKKGASMDDDNPDAYKPAPGDKEAKTKESKHTKKYRDMYGEEVINEDATAALKKKAEKSGISLSILRKVYNRGVAAWRTGHRPGTTPEQWGLARVNSFITKGKGTWGKADKDLASKVKKESVDEALKVTHAQIKGAAKSMSSSYIEKSSIDKVIALIKHIGKRVTMNKSNISKATYTVEGGKTFSSLRREMVEPFLEEDLEESAAFIVKHKTGDTMYSKSYKTREAAAAAAEKMRKAGAQSVSITTGEVSEEETQDEACWDGYKEVGMKKKGNKMVPNCVPEETDVEEAMIRTRAAHGDELKRREKISKALKGKPRKKTFSSMRSRLTDETEEQVQEAATVSRKDFDKLKKGDMITITYGSSISSGQTRTFQVKGKSRSAKYNVDKVNMVDPNRPGGMKFHLYSRDGKDATLALGDMGATIKSYSIKESVELEEKDLRKMDHDTFMKYGDENPRGRADPAWNAERKRRYRNDQSRMYRRMKKESVELEEKRDAGKSATGYDIYHDTYSAAMQHAYAHAKKKHGVTVRPSEIDDKVASGPRKPSTGKTVSHILKTDKKQNLHVQVYNTGRKYELNMYVESVELDENQTAFTRKELEAGNITIRKDKNGWRYLVNKSKSGAMGPYRTDAQVRTAIMKIQKESVELDNEIDLMEVMVKAGGKKSEVAKMSPSQIAQLRKAYAGIERINVTGPGYKKAKKFIASLSKDELMVIAKAKIKWLSQFAAQELNWTHKVKLKPSEYMSEGWEPLDESMYKVEIEGMPASYMPGKSPGEVKNTLRRLLKKPDYIRMIKRVPESEMKKHFRDKAAGKEEVEESTKTFSSMMEAMDKKLYARLEKLMGPTQNVDQAIDVVAKNVTKGDKVKAKKLVTQVLKQMMGEETLAEVLSPKDPLEKWIHDFVHSDDKRFEGKSKEERIRMATGAYYAAQKNEALDPVGKADADIDNDGDVDSSDKYLHNRRKTIKKAMKRKKKEEPSESDDDQKISGKKEKVTINPKIDDK